MGGFESSDTQGYKVYPDQPPRVGARPSPTGWLALEERGAQECSEFHWKPGADPARMGSDEARIIGGLSMGDEEALGSLMDRYGGALLHFAHRLVGDLQTAEEICQDTMLKAWQQASALRMDGHLKAWLFRVARNNAIDHIRRRRLLTEEYPRGAEPAATTAQPEVEAERSWVAEEIISGVQSLPDHYQKVITMRFFQQMCYQEMATLLGIPLGTVKSRLNYALQRLSRTLLERGIGPTLLDL